jgi:hypothetical protein
MTGGSVADMFETVATGHILLADHAYDRDAYAMRRLSAAPQLRSYESSGNLWLPPSELKDGSHFWLSKAEGSSHETLCRTGPVDGNHAGLHCR